ncbi:MAG: TlpA family protein disulfide reductase [Deinococcota bacterium]
MSNKNLLILAIGLFFLVPGQAVAQCCPILPPQSAPIQKDAATFDPARYKGQVLVVNFMAAWCPSCYAEIPGFVKLYPKLQGKGVAFVAVAVQTTREETEALIKRFSIPYPVYLDESGGVAVDRYRLQAMPTTLVFDRQGRKVKDFRGEVSAEALWAYLGGLL